MAPVQFGTTQFGLNFRPAAGLPVAAPLQAKLEALVTTNRMLRAAATDSPNTDVWVASYPDAARGNQPFYRLNVSGPRLRLSQVFEAAHLEDDTFVRQLAKDIQDAEIRTGPWAGFTREEAERARGIAFTLNGNRHPLTIPAVPPPFKDWKACVQGFRL